MDAIEAELLEGERKSDARGRKIVSPARREELLAAYDRQAKGVRALFVDSGLTNGDSGLHLCAWPES